MKKSSYSQDDDMHDLDIKLKKLEISEKEMGLWKLKKPWWKSTSILLPAISLLIAAGGVYTGIQGGAFEEEKLQRRIANIELERDRIELKLESAQEEVDDLIRKDTTLQDGIARLEKERKELAGVVQRLENETTSLDDTIKKLENDKSKLAGTVQELEKKRIKEHDKINQILDNIKKTRLDEQQSVIDLEKVSGLLRDAKIELQQTQKKLEKSPNKPIQQTPKSGSADG